MGSVDPFAFGPFVPLFGHVTRVPGTTHAHHRMYGVLASFRGKGPVAECRPKNIGKIRERFGTKDERTVRKLIADLVDLGLIVADRSENGRGKPTRYEFVAHAWMVNETPGEEEPEGQVAPGPAGDLALGPRGKSPRSL